MNIEVRKYNQADISEMVEIWNEVVGEGIAFPQLERLNEKTGIKFFSEQSYCGVAQNRETKEILGVFILHPNNIGRCGHICNASYAVKSNARGLHIGEKLVTDCLNKGKERGFRILQLNAVVKTNYGARHLYEKLGFISLGEIPGGFMISEEKYEDIVPYYHIL